MRCGLGRDWEGELDGIAHTVLGGRRGEMIVGAAPEGGLGSPLLMGSCGLPVGFCLVMASMIRTGVGLPICAMALMVSAISADEAPVGP
jgi:hypothetical protein